MADVSSTLRQWSTTAASNSPTSTTTIGANLAPNLQTIQAVVRQFLSSKGTDIASATTTDLSTMTGSYAKVTGNTTITGLGTENAGTWYILEFSGALTLTYNASSLILPGAANITTAAGDLALCVSEGSGNWRVMYFPVSGKNVITPAQPTRTVLTSGTAATYTTPAGATRINVRMVGGGGGGGGATANNGTAGNNTSFGALTGSGGGSGLANGSGGGAGGAASGGDINISGGGGGSGVSNPTWNPAGGTGGNTAFGGGGNSQENTAGGNGATNSGGGGSGGGNIADPSGGGGGGGGYVEKLIIAPSATYTYTVGAAANGGAAGTNAGGNGAAGIIIVDEYYN